MSFWEDLQAWTQAQFDALMLANLKRKKKWTAEDINRLLRDRISKRLKAKLGTGIDAEFLRTGSRRGISGRCAPVLSGLYSVAHYLFGDIYLPSPAPEGTTEHYAFLQRSSGGYWSAAAFASSPDFDNHFAHPTGDTYRFPNSLVTKKAGLFTGEMKRVVQLLAGQNAEIPYGYQWAKTHGIYVNQISGARWVVEIESNGITVWPLLESSVACTYGANPDTWQVPVPVEDLSTVTGKVVLCNAAYLADLYDNGGPLLGPYLTWAFSGSGHEAQVVIAYPGFGPGGDYTKSFRYKLYFDSDENGDPASVTLTLEQEGYVYTRDISKNVRAPVLSGSCGPSHPLALFSTGLNNPPVSGAFSFPLTVFYFGDAEQVFTFTHKPPTLEDTEEATPHPTMDPLDCASFIYDPAYIGTDLYSARATTRGGSTITGIPWAETDIDNTWTVAEYTHTRFDLTENGGPGGCTSGDPAVTAQWGVYGSSHKLVKTVVRYPSHSKLYQFCLVFPWFEREAYLFQERWIETQDDPVIKYTSSKRVLGTSWHNSGSNIGLTAWNLLNDTLYCLTGPLFYKYLGQCFQTDPTPPVAITDYVPWQSNTFYPMTGPTTTCCEDFNTKFVTYAAGSPITKDDTCNVEDEISPSIDTDTDLFQGKITSSGVGRTVTLPSALTAFFSGGLFEDLGACSLLNSDPFWFGVWADAFTGAGWIKHEGYDATDIQIIRGADGLYPMIVAMPISVEFSGWFGVPFPENSEPS